MTSAVNDWKALEDTSGTMGRGRSIIGSYSDAGPDTSLAPPSAWSSIPALEPSRLFSVFLEIVANKFLTRVIGFGSFAGTVCGAEALPSGLSAAGVGVAWGAFVT